MKAANVQDKGKSRRLEQNRSVNIPSKQPGKIKRSQKKHVG